MEINIQSNKQDFSFATGMLIDTHCHLDMSAFANDLDAVVARAISVGIKKIITIGIDLPSSERAIGLANKYPQISASIGFHPHDVDSLESNDYRLLEKLYKANSHHIVGLGEIGLDYFKNHSDPDKQRYHFAKQLDIAHEIGLPVIIHNRAAGDDILKILRKAKPLEYGGVMHCFSENYAYAQKILDLNMQISIPGIVTFKNSIILQEVAKKIPLNAMLLETDGPFLAPQPFRGKRNEPSYLLNTAKKIAELRNIDFETLAKQTTKNAESLFFPTKE